MNQYLDLSFNDPIKRIPNRRYEMECLGNCDCSGSGGPDCINDCDCDCKSN